LIEKSFWKSMTGLKHFRPIKRKIYDSMMNFPFFFYEAGCGGGWGGSTNIGSCNGYVGSTESAGCAVAGAGCSSIGGVCAGVTAHICSMGGSGCGSGG
jgi:hypothetical protein